MMEPTAREMIPTLLDQHRPDRYDPTDHDWWSPVVDAVAEDVSVAEARMIAATRLVSNAEAAATRRTNKMLREIGATGALPLDWLDALAWPLAIGDNERVTLRAATEEDLRKFALRERTAAVAEFTTRNESCDGALILADLMASSGVTLAGRLPAPSGDGHEAAA